MESKTRIIDSAVSLFLKYGVKSVSMDDISRELGVSKKTLYTFVKNKEELIAEAIKSIVANQSQTIQSIQTKSSDALNEMIEIARFILQFLRNMKPSLTYDLQKYYPKVWDLVENEHKTFMKESIIKNLKDGIEQGLYRDNINIDIVSEMYVGLSRLITDEDVFPLAKYNKLDLYLQKIYYHLNGIVNTKGRSQLKKIYKNISE